MGVFVGRQRELATLVARLESALDGAPAVALLAGEPGIGKTRLAAELEATAAERGCEVRWGRCWEGPGAPALWPWTQVVGNDEQLPAPSDGRLETDDDRFVIYEAIAEKLRARAAKQPVVAVLDDLHWADPLSLGVLQFVAQHLRTGRVLIVGTYRETEARRDAEQGSILAHLARHATTVPLRGLSSSEIGTFVNDTFGTRLSATTLAALHEATAGNPFFVDEVMRLLIAEGSVDNFDVRRVPDGVREATRRRLDLVDPDARERLGTAAVVGRDFSIAVLEGVTGASRQELVNQLDDAAAAGLVQSSDNGYRFTHALVRETLYGDLDAADRVAIHRRVAESLERFYGGDVDAHAAELAHHFAQAQGAREASKAARYDLTAGGDAIRRFAYEQAVEHARHGLLAVNSTANPDLRLRSELHLLDAKAQLRLSDAPALKEAASRAAADARAAGSNEHLARAAIIYGSMATAWDSDPDGVALCESALDAVGATRPDLRARVLCSLAWMHVTPGNLDAADRPSERGLELARQIDSPPTLCRALYVRHEVFTGTAKAAEQLSLADELVSVAERNYDVYWRAQGHRCRALSRLALGNASGFEDDMEAMARLGQTLHSRVHQSLADNWRATRALLRGDFDQVEAHSNRALMTLQGDPDAIKAYAAQLFWLRHEQGRLHEIQSLVATSVDQEPGLAPARAVAGQVAAELGDHEAAARHLDHLLRGGLHKIKRDWGWSMTMTSIASILALRADRDPEYLPVVAAVAELLEPFRHQLVVVASATHVPGAFDRYRGMMLSMLGEWAEAEEAFLDALRLERGAGAVALMARTQYWHAQMLVARGLDADRSRARDLLTLGAEEAQQRGMMRLAEQAEKLSACV